MRSIISRLGEGQFYLACLVGFGICLITALRPLPDPAVETVGAQDLRSNVQFLQNTDLSDAVLALVENGFVKVDDSNTGNPVRSTGAASMAEQSLGSAHELPRIFAFVEDKSGWQAYVRDETDLIIAYEGDQVGPWLFERISQGEIVLTSEDRTEVIDVFGAADEAEE